MPAAEFATEYRKDPGAAGKKFDGRILELTGKIRELGPSQSEGESHIFLEDGRKFTLGLTCWILDPQPWAQYAPGQEITIRGRVSGTSFDAGLVSCVVVKAGPSPAITVSAPELAKEFADDAEAARKVYDRKWVVVAGEVLKKKVDSTGSAEVILKGTDDVAMHCFVAVAPRPLARGIRVGQTLRLAGRCGDFLGGSVGLESARPIREKRAEQP